MSILKPFDDSAIRKIALEIRENICFTIINHGEGHGAPALSCADIMAVLYGAVLRFDVHDSVAQEADKLILSAGHKCLALYGALAAAGVIPKEILDTYNQLGTMIPGHPDMTKLKGVQFSSGSLGHGLPVGCGLALASKMKGYDCRTYVIMGDGEHGEGSVWEAAAFASHHHLDHLVAIVDENGLQINGTTRQVLYPSSFEKRYEGFGWKVFSVDGHDYEALYRTFEEAMLVKGQPVVIIAKTIKGKGISFMENNGDYHHWNPSNEEKEIALGELAGMRRALYPDEEVIYGSK